MPIIYSDLDSKTYKKPELQNINNPVILNDSPIEKEQAMRKYFEVGDGALSDEELKQMTELFNKINEAAINDKADFSNTPRLLEKFDVFKMIVKVLIFSSILAYIIKTWISSGLIDIWF